MNEGVGKSDRGYNMQLASGKPFFLSDPKPEDIEISDIAHSLSNLCRFNGHCKRFYSVAEHSIYVSRLVPNNLKLCALLHDATEVYIGDITRPVREYIFGVEELEESVWRVIADRFDLPEKMPEEVLEADNRILAEERLKIMAAPNGVNWGELPPASDVITFKQLSPKDASLLFIDHYYQYGGE